MALEIPEQQVAGETSPHTGLDAPGFRVWAPGATRVALQLDGQEHDMTRRNDGWWTAAHRTQDGLLYGYLVDGNGPAPDPRSPFQPFGVHGLWQQVDHARYAFTAAIGRLADLVELGVTHVELMPVAEFPATVAGGMTASTSSPLIMDTELPTSSKPW